MDIWQDAHFWFGFFDSHFDMANEKCRAGMILKRDFAGHGGTLQMSGVIGKLFNHRKSMRGFVKVAFKVNGLFTLKATMSYKSFETADAYLEQLEKGLTYWIDVGGLSLPYFADREFGTSELKLNKGVKKSDVEAFLALMVLSKNNE